MRIAVVGVQGDVEEHIIATKKAMDAEGLKGEVIPVRKQGVVPDSDGIIIPGGESTTISRLIFREGIAEEILALANNDVPVMGTCAGLITLAKHGDEEVKKTGQKLLRLMDVQVKRNAFGRQRESFEVPLEVKNIGIYPAVFIRAPAIVGVGKEVEVLATFEDFVVGARQDNIISFAFHPELTDDLRIHRYFLAMCKTASRQ
jgi:5'-phosphate synthase pdxT subunit